LSTRLLLWISSFARKCSSNKIATSLKMRYCTSWYRAWDMEDYFWGQRKTSRASAKCHWRCRHWHPGFMHRSSNRRRAVRIKQVGQPKLAFPTCANGQEQPLYLKWDRHAAFWSCLKYSFERSSEITLHYFKPPWRDCISLTLTVGRWLDIGLHKCCPLAGNSHGRCLHVPGLVNTDEDTRQNVTVHWPISIPSVTFWMQVRSGPLEGLAATWLKSCAEFLQRGSHHWIRAGPCSLCARWWGKHGVDVRSVVCLRPPSQTQQVWSMASYEK